MKVRNVLSWNNKEECLVQIKRIKLSPKRGGNGFVSSFSVNIGSQEARDCGLLCGEGDNLAVVKIMNSAKGEIVIKAKDYTLTNDIIRAFLKSRYASTILTKWQWMQDE